jgi:hypothetical protein
MRAEGMAIQPAVTPLVDNTRDFQVSLIDRLGADIAWVIEVHGELLVGKAHSDGGLASDWSVYGLLGSWQSAVLFRVVADRRITDCLSISRQAETPASRSGMKPP